ncbi:hypothetical protein AX660_17620 [Paraglaciecola hydrolytica]|uniref:FlgO domain-containing protein n=1 Tax=Paraglaciecola hydrolytica TaxID=1799789 RepID=A0A135ZZ11_9ALTE|nr:hypothetical protein AX660_17620 [Paraglaciecola hydrolytica]
MAYLVLAWLVIQVTSLAVPALNLPDWVNTLVFFFGLIGFPFALFFAWAFEITPDGIKMESQVDRTESITHVTNRKLDFVIIGLLFIALIYFVWESRFSDNGNAVEAESSVSQSVTVDDSVAVVNSLDKSIAVLPFVNLSSDPEQDYFSDGISEELLNVLAQFRNLRVAARTSSFQFKDDNRDVSEIAKLLKVNHILEGSVRKSGTKLRITAQLIEAENGYHLWSQTYDRELKDIFAIQDEISAAIGHALQAEMKLQVPDNNGNLGAPKVVEAANTAAYEAYLHGRHLINQRGNKAITEAVRYLEKAIRLDSNYAPAHAQLAIAIAMLSSDSASYGDLTLTEVNQRASPHIDKAMALNPMLAEAWGAKTLLALTNHNEKLVLEYAAKALAINPVYIDVLNWQSASQQSLRLYKESEVTLQHLLEIDPLSIIGQFNYAMSKASSEPEKAEAIAKQLLKQYPWAGYRMLDMIEFFKGELAKSLHWILKAYAEDPLDSHSNQAVVFTLSMVGLGAEARRISDDSLPFAAYLSQNYDDAIKLFVNAIEQDPQNNLLQYFYISSLYFSRQWEGLKEKMDQFQALLGADKLLSVYTYTLEMATQYAYILQQTNHQDEADHLISLIDIDLAKKQQLSSYRSTHSFYKDKAFRAWLDNDKAKTLRLLRQSFALGNRRFTDFHDPMLDSLKQDPEYRPQYLALLSELDAALAAEKIKVLELICHNNPIADSWQALPETCAN